MIFRFACTVLLVASFALADAPTTAPSTQPTGQKKQFPNLADLIAQQKAEQAAEARKAQVAVFSFSSPIVEQPAGFSLFGENDAVTLRSVVTRMHKARDDKDLKAVLVIFRVGAGMNLAQAHELRDALAEIRKSGKKVFVYSDTYDTGTYTVASAADNICMLESGEIMIPGIGIETMFYRGTMDKVGVVPDFVQIGEFKGAEEPYTRTGPSEELRGELNRLVDSIYGLIVDGIANSRSLSRDTVRRAIDDTMITGVAARERGLVDHLIDYDGLTELLEQQLGGEVNYLRNYAGKAKKEVDWSNIFAVLKAMNEKPEETTGPSVALIYAEGTIVDGTGAGGLFEEGGVGSETMRQAFRTALQDGNVKAVVIRIDSPGGSALASEVMWQSARRLSKDKPVIISIGGMAASGGYYLASAGDYIFADPSAIVGSIGVVGGKFVLKDLYDKVGLATETFSKGRNADLYSSTKVWDEKQRGLVKKSMEQVYAQFTDRVLRTRRDKIQDIDKVARGRIFLAEEARKLGMVDEIAGLETAIAYAADRAGLSNSTYDVTVLPAPKTLADFFGGGAGASSPVRGMLAGGSREASTMDAVLHLLPETTRKNLAQQVRMMKLLEKRSVVLMAPFTVTVR